jgi:hypothetical protein
MVLTNGSHNRVFSRYGVQLPGAGGRLEVAALDGLNKL